MESINSFVTLAEKITLLNRNCVEILTKVNDLVSSQSDSVNIVYDDNGVINSYSQPTVGYLKNQIDTLNQNVKRMASIDGYTYIKDGYSHKRIMTTDLNREPVPMNDISQISKFTPVNNHFFESLMNPMLAVNIDLTDKVDLTVNTILSRRYIIKFEKNPDGTLTENGLISFNSFSTTFLNRTGINITDFVAWYNNPSTNIGIVVDKVEPYDEQIYDLNLKQLNYYGVFSVIKIELDDINNKMWYHFNTIKYYGNDGSTNSLKIGDELIINKINSSSRYKIKEINTDSSNNKIRLEIVEGYDPVIVGTNTLKYYSDFSSQKNVKINVGFDEYIVLFLKPINTENNIVGSLWSKGVCFYTNDLLLDTNSNIKLANYYIKAVYDYGIMLEDMINRQMPTLYGVTPNPVILYPENFKVVQINKHLTDDKDQEELMKAHSNKQKVKTEISQINSAINQKTIKLNSGGLSKIEKQTLLNEINKLKADLEIATSNLSSLLVIINELSSGQNRKIEPKFRLRGFWNIPEPIISDKTEPQHVKQFRVQYRYSSRNGNYNFTETFKYMGVGMNPNNIQGGSLVAVITPNNSSLIPDDRTTGNSSKGIAPSTNAGKTTPIEATDVANTSEIPTNPTQYANFSNWVEYLTDARKKYWDEKSRQWYWKIENVADPETPNINQLDIPIQKYERVEVRIKSISEVGWPDALIESDWSDVLSIEFPDDLVDVDTDNEFILNEASQDKINLSIDNVMQSRGLTRHISDSYIDYQNYISHKDTSIQVSFNLNQSNNVNLFQYLTYLTNRISYLEQLITSAKGTLNILLYKDNELIKTISNNSNTLINIECEDYGNLVAGSGRTYYNDLYLIDDYVVSLENTNQSGFLSFLSNRTYTSGGNNAFYTSNGQNNKILIVDYDNNLYTQSNNQFIWFSDRDNNDWISSGATSSSSIVSILDHPSYNFGATGYSTLLSPLFNANDIFSITTGSTNLLTAVFPYLPDISLFIENSQDKVKIIKPQNKFNIGFKIFFKFDGTQNTSTPTSLTTYSVSTGSYDKKIRKVKFWFESNDGIIYQFIINFTINRQKLYYQSNINNSSLTPNYGGSEL